MHPTSRRFLLSLSLLAFAALDFGPARSADNQNDAHSMGPPGWTPRLERAARLAPHERLAAWVYFTDKGPDIDVKLAKAEADLTVRARARRARNRGANDLVDRHDIPVEAKYAARVKDLVERIRHRSRWLNAVSVDATATQLEAVATLPFVDRVDLVFQATVPLPQPEFVEGPTVAPAPASPTALTYGASFTQNDQINVPPLHSLGYAGNGVLICVLDTGFNLIHDAFAILDVHAAWDFVNNDPVVSNENGQFGSHNHGTWVLGTIAGFAPGELIGPAWGATYMLGKTENTDWERHIEEDHWVAGSEWADTEGADIITSSLGYLDGFTNGEADYSWTDMDGNTTVVTLGANIAASRGILVVNSAGNEGAAVAPANSLIAPADGASVLTVGAVDANGVRANFSSMGPTADGRTKPDVMAMGVATRTVSANSPSVYGNLNGTSFACPLTAGAAALVLEVNPTFSNLEIIDALRSTADNAGSPDNAMGWGILDADAAAASGPSGVRVDAPLTLTLFPAFPNPFNPSTTLRYELAAPARVTLRIYDVTGREVVTLVDTEQAAGPKAFIWNGTNNAGGRVATGVYYYEVNAAGVKQSRPVVLIK
jgi:subtilisin family serine protease